jgi:hypothetical protein
MGMENFRRIGRKVLRIGAVVIVFIMVIFIAWKYFYTYSKGYRAGLLQKFTYKGQLFKTYEGELILSSITSKANVSIASEKFYFSVVDEDLAKQLDTLQGQFVTVHYRQKNGTLFWRGDTPYFVDEVKVKK